jgi:3-oxoacyl-[acyl-carrier protein] reductase
MRYQKLVQFSIHSVPQPSRTDNRLEQLMPGVENRVALVTGGGQGIGAAVAARLAAGGASVGVLDINAEAAESVAADIRASGGRALALAADVTDREQVTAAVDTTVAASGGLHILVNNAGVTRDNLLFK